MCVYACVHVCERSVCDSSASSTGKAETHPAGYSAVAMFMIATTSDATWWLPETSTIDDIRARLFVRVTNHESLSLVADAREKQRKNVVNFVVSVLVVDGVIVSATRVSVALGAASRQQ